MTKDATDVDGPIEYFWFVGKLGKKPNNLCDLRRQYKCPNVSEINGSSNDQMQGTNKQRLRIILWISYEYKNRMFRCYIEIAFQIVCPIGTKVKLSISAIGYKQGLVYI